MPFVLLFVALAFFLFAPVLDSGSVGETILNAIKKGSRLTHSSSADGVVIDEDPLSLANEAGLDINTYSMARGISSEEGNSSQLRQAAVGWVMRNNGGDDIFGYVTGGGPFGRQGGIRKVTTFVDPYQGHAEIAKLVISGQYPDPTNGATMFVAPASQEALHAENPVKYKSFADVEAIRLASGLKRIEVPGIPPSKLVFYG